MRVFTVRLQRCHHRCDLDKIRHHPPELQSCLFTSRISQRPRADYVGDCQIKAFHSTLRAALTRIPRLNTTLYNGSWGGGVNRPLNGSTLASHVPTSSESAPEDAHSHHPPDILDLEISHVD